jgi:hypothetical protein
MVDISDFNPFTAEDTGMDMIGAHHFIERLLDVFQQELGFNISDPDEKHPFYKLFVTQHITQTQCKKKKGKHKQWKIAYK